MAQKRKGNTKGRQQQRSNKSFGMNLSVIKPKTYAQEQVFEAFYENNLLLHGYPGTGKTFLALYLALREVLENETYRKIIIFRSAVQTRDQGFLPGTEDEKMAVFERPYREIVNELFGRGDAYDILKGKGVVEFESTSFARGITLDDCVVIADEIGNMSFAELDMIITRIGDNAKLILSGDYRQSDLKKAEKDGLKDFIRVIDAMGKRIEHVEFQASDIVRSDFVKAYIIAKVELGL
jgi:phosphate starvation-inducible protein PhoH